MIKTHKKVVQENAPPPVQSNTSFIEFSDFWHMVLQSFYPVEYIEWTEETFH